MEPVPRARLCHDDEPGRDRAALAAPLEVVAAPGGVLLGGDRVDARGRQALGALLPRPPLQRPRLGVGTAQRIDRVAEVVEELAVLPPHDVGPRHRLEGRRGERRRDGVGPLVDPVREPADVEDAGDRRRVRLDHAGLEVQRGAHDAHAVDRLEESQRRRLVGDAVLHRHHRDALGCRGGERAERLAGVLALHREEHDVVVAEVDARRVRHDRDGERHRLLIRRRQPQAAVADRVVVVATRDQQHVVPVLRQPATHHPADGAGAVDHESHVAAASHTGRGSGGRSSREWCAFRSLGSSTVPPAQVRSRARAQPRREDEAGDGAAAVTLLERDRAAVERRDLRDDRQAETGPRQRARAGRPVEAVEHPRAVLGCDAGAAVGDLQRRAAHGHRHRRAVEAELQRVVDQIRDRAVEHRPPALDDTGTVGVDHDLVTGPAPEPRRDVVRHLGQRYRLDRFLAPDVGGQLDHLAHQVGELVELEPGLGDELRALARRRASWRGRGSRCWCGPR